ncbi:MULTISPECIES: acetolactate synthase 2 small subunit [Avibacterium]|uniref:Acetolactate synthase 2 small subunit n=1 Tax=Avibacterium paragallinarum TaxID=728 RepID=A0AAE5TFY4_AVIPA|nr:acetolactate synthase 2 small subunit [Avibacterium paragallinarum]MEE3608501.1 acetolactate synthase 2 small subunit [Avibacterium paragallinarum]MEE3621798.1 acetolactate synthase 2 small subunit [Avibacterium paragallinarum]MEE3669553.1 acetolactate synthase 2 small subunit [Avibacterium paragallinarum]MEE3680194.1 acetolactate synthase 2 small subunit [Avibacterium paragallinarum]MEE4385293.1 acetolactate synthase 2 small subunit [Avibacterium paragallinarum]
MQQYELSIRANRRPETLERLLRVMRHRGFEVIKLQTESQQQEIAFHVVVQSERAVELLVNQLVKLPDVLELK